MPGMTPAFSRQLALIAQAPLWQSPEGIEQWLAFLDRVTRYPTYAALPADLKAVFAQAQQSLGAPISDAAKDLARRTGYRHHTGDTGRAPRR